MLVLKQVTDFDYIFRLDILKTKSLGQIDELVVFE